MLTRFRFPGITALAVLALFSAPAQAAPPEDKMQSIDDLRKTAPRVYIDAERLDMNYIRDEINFVNHVRDRKEADVHVLITRQGTGSGGQEYTLAFLGQGICSALQNTLKFYTDQTMTEDNIRKGLVQILKLGLAPYVAATPMGRTLDLRLLGQVRSTSVEDKWNFWVFNLSARSRLNGEQARKSSNLSGSATVSRITPEMKLRISAFASYDQSRFDYEDTSFTSTSQSRSVSALYVHSMGQHWSVGATVAANYSTYSNYAFSVAVHPAIEYDLFPYSESTRRQLRFLYKIGYNYDKYLQLTIYQKLLDRLWSEALSVTLEIKEPWGDAEFSLEGSHYFHDFRLNRFQVSGELGVRLLKGLSVNLNARYSKVADQLNLKAGTASLEELLLRRSELASAYRYGISVGLSYSFGSVYSNVVNPRFGSGMRQNEMHY